MKNPNALEAKWESMNRPSHDEHRVFSLASAGTDGTYLLVNHEPNVEDDDGDVLLQPPGYNWIHVALDDSENPVSARYLGEGRYSVKVEHPYYPNSFTLFLGGNVVQALLDVVTTVELEIR